MWVDSQLVSTLLTRLLSHFEGVSTMEVGSVKCTAYANDGKVQGMEDGGEEDGEGSVEP